MDPVTICCWFCSYYIGSIARLIEVNGWRESTWYVKDNGKDFLFCDTVGSVSFHLPGSPTAPSSPCPPSPLFPHSPIQQPFSQQKFAHWWRPLPTTFHSRPVQSGFNPPQQVDWLDVHSIQFGFFLTFAVQTPPMFIVADWMCIQCGQAFTLVPIESISNQFESIHLWCGFDPDQTGLPITGDGFAWLHYV